jgi:hypothetical protein
MRFCLVEVAVIFRPLDYGVLQRLVIGVFQWARESKNLVQTSPNNSAVVTCEKETVTENKGAG